jgi:hypothetical protein
MLAQSGARRIRLSVETLRCCTGSARHSVRAVAKGGSGVSRSIRTSYTKSACLGLRELGPAIPATTKITHPTPPSRAFYTRMKKNGRSLRGRQVMSHALAAMEQMELYCEAHPRSPAAVRRPRLFVRGELWIALLGPSVEEGIVGIGPTVTAALRAFDAEYLAGLRPPVTALGNYRPARSPSSAVA